MYPHQLDRQKANPAGLSSIYNYHWVKKKNSLLNNNSIQTTLCCLKNVLNLLKYLLDIFKMSYALIFNVF